MPIDIFKVMSYNDFNIAFFATISPNPKGE